ncbi:MAG TPA: sigma-70 family RNA polymerase sigma factor [Polyangiaceae bacterium]|nr:sigma-70 family RNA polymerase sigma factor [Polyangiaceae bacterium]
MAEGKPSRRKAKRGTATRAKTSARKAAKASKKSAKAGTTRAVPETAKAGKTAAAKGKTELMGAKRAVVRRGVALPTKKTRIDGTPNPDKKQLKEAEAEARKALKEFERQGGGDSTLSKYFREMASHRVLTPQEEIAAAQDVERLEIGYWESLLSCLPAFETVAAVIERYVKDEPLPQLAALRKIGRSATRSKLTKKDQAKWDSVALELSTKLRALDSDRIFVNQADKAVHRLVGDNAVDRDMLGDEVRITPAFRKYLARVEHAQEAQQRGKNRFVASNLRLVVSIARRYNRGRLPLIDLIQEGNIGLMKAVERFDHNRGYRFSTYASWWIRHAISRALADKGRAVRIPVHMLDTYNRVARATQAIATRTGKQPTPEELEKETGIAAEKLEKIKGYWAETPFSLDRPVNDEDGRKFIDFLEQENVPTPFEQLVSKTWGQELRRLLGTLTPMEARILRWRFGLDDEDELTLKEIGDKYNLSRERIRQLQEQALTKIRRQIKE